MALSKDLVGCVQWVHRRISPWLCCLPSCREPVGADGLSPEDGISSLWQLSW